MKTFIFIFLISIVTYQSAISDDCDCIGMFDFAYSKIEKNYSGWRDKVNPSTEAEFQELTNRLRLKASEVTKDVECLLILNEWISFFKDGHTGISIAGSAPIEDSTVLNKILIDAEKINLDEEVILKYFSMNIDRLNPAEGIWRTADSSYVIAVVKNQNDFREYAGVILKGEGEFWFPGFVKMELSQNDDLKYKTVYYSKYHVPYIESAVISNNVMSITRFGNWYKVFPISEASEESDGKASGKFEFHSLNENTVYISIPTFEHQFKPVVDSLIKSHEEVIFTSENMIIDLRGNGGGSDVTYQILLPILYTKTFNFLSSSLHATDDNISKFVKLLDDPSFPEESKEYVVTLIDSLNANKGGFYFREDFLQDYDSVSTYPKNIVILFDNECASSCEQFLLAARQSDKSILMGTNSAGILDYANIHSEIFPNGKWYLYWATSRSNRLPDFPVDNIGIEPDIFLLKNENWILKAVEFLNK